MESKKVLIVDDEPDILDTIRFQLDQEGYEVSTAENGWEALGAIRAIQPDLVILDVMLPKENGYRVSRMIKDDEQSGQFSKKIPVIMMTARNISDDPEREKMFSDFSRANKVLYKPFEMETLFKEVRSLL